jgi:hypothetical protein
MSEKEQVWYDFLVRLFSTFSTPCLSCSDQLMFNQHIEPPIQFLLSFDMLVVRQPINHNSTSDLLIFPQLIFH